MHSLSFSPRHSHAQNYCQNNVHTKLISFFCWRPGIDVQPTILLLFYRLRCFFLLSFSFTFQRNWLLNNNNNNFSTETKQREGSKNKSIFFPLPSNCYSSISFISMFVTPCMFGNFRCTTNCWSFSLFRFGLKIKLSTRKELDELQKWPINCYRSSFIFIYFFYLIFHMYYSIIRIWLVSISLYAPIKCISFAPYFVAVIFFSFYSLPKSDRSNVVIIRFRIWIRKNLLIF